MASIEALGDDIKATEHVLKFLKANTEIFLHGTDSGLNAIRALVRTLSSTLEKQEYEGLTQREYITKRLRGAEKELKKSREKRLRDLDKAYINNRQLREGRIEALLALTAPTQLLLSHESESHSTVTPITNELNRKRKAEEEGQNQKDTKVAKNASSQSEKLAEASREAADLAAFMHEEAERLYQEEDKELRSKKELFYPRSCYICKRRFYQLHHFYDQLCPECADLNWKKRNQTADLRGKVALVTGCRMKIGFRCGLKLLRCGAIVLATTRFPHDAALRFAREADFDMWKRNLHIFGIDLRDLRSVIRLCDRIASSYPKLDMIINNAAQTIRRPAAYYRHLLPNELQPARVPSEARSLVQADPHNANDTKAPLSLDHASTEQFERLPTAFVEEVKGTGNDTQVLRDLVASMGTNSTEVQPMKLSNTHAYTYLYQVLPVSQSPPNLRAPTVVTTPTLFPAPEASTSALMTQHVVHPEDAASEKTKEAFPVGLYDVEGAQIDLRKENSWVLLLHQVDPAELVEVFAVNALAPFIINSRLRELLQRGQGNKFIVNVSAMEGKFYRHKGPQHPHTNMAKAALNMMTRTSACEYAEHKIYMNSIDTGWINDENPFEAAQRIAGTNFQTPIDEEDAMARVLDPVLTDSTVFGKFLKDFNETEW